MPVIGDIAQSRKAIADAGKHAVTPVGRYAAGGITGANLCAREDGNKFVDEREGCVRGDRAVERTIERGRNVEQPDRKSVGEGKSVSVRVELGGRRIINKQRKDSYDI